MGQNLPPFPRDRQCLHEHKFPRMVRTTCLSSALLSRTFILVQCYFPLVVSQDHSCELSTLFEHLNEIQDNCCGDGSCRQSGYPDEDDACDQACGEIFEPFWDICGEMLHAMRVDGTRGMSVFYDTCLSTLYPPGVQQAYVLSVSPNNHEGFH